MPSIPVPTIVERTPRGERSWDLFSRLLRERVILLGTAIDDDVASLVVAQLLFLQHADPERDIWFYINSPGGSVRDGLAIYDTMHLVSCDVNTVCIGRAGSMATPNPVTMPTMVGHSAQRRRYPVASPPRRPPTPKAV